MLMHVPLEFWGTLMELHHYNAMHTLVQNVQNVKIINKQFIWWKNDAVNPTKYFDFHTASPSTLSCNIHMARTDDSGLFREPTTYYFFCLKSVYTASAFLVADFSKLYHILVSHVLSVLSQTNKLFSSLISPSLFYDLTRDSIANNFVIDLYCTANIYSF